MSRSGRRILLLYWAAERQPRLAVEQHLRALRYLGSGDDVVAVNAADGAPRALRALRPSVVVLHTTFLGLRWTRGFERRRERSAWLAKVDAVKIALPQDDYDHAGVLDDWLDELGVDVVFTALSRHADLLYPLTSRRAEIRAALTGYVDDETVAIRPRPAPIGERALDVAYRATRLPYWFGSHGQLKHRVGEVARSLGEERGLDTDISTQPTDAIRGAAWLDFLESARTVVGCESGSSVLDRRGEVRRTVEQTLAAHPETTFEQFAAQMPAGWDEHRFFAVSPRHLEAAASGTAQILVEGTYDGVLEPERHYLPVRRDLSDLGEALDRSRDEQLLQRLADAAFEDVCLSGRYGYRTLAADLDRAMTEHGARPGGDGIGRRALGGSAVTVTRVEGLLRNSARRILRG